MTVALVEGFFKRQQSGDALHRTRDLKSLADFQRAAENLFPVREPSLDHRIAAHRVAPHFARHIRPVGTVMVRVLDSRCELGATWDLKVVYGMDRPCLRFRVTVLPSP